jgi:hypothetical protein
MPGSMSRSWRRDSNETASDEPGAVHDDLTVMVEEELARRKTAETTL